MLNPCCRCKTERVADIVVGPEATPRYTSAPGVVRGLSLSLLMLCLQHAPAAFAAPSCDTTWPHALNVHGSDGQIDHKGQAWGLESDSANNGLFGARAGKVNAKGECFDTNDELLDGCVGAGAADSLGPPEFLEFDDNNPPDETITADTTYTNDREFGSLTITDGAVLTIEGPLIIKVDGGLEIDEGATLRVKDVADGQVASVYAGKGFSLDDGNVEVATAGTLEVRASDFGANNGSDLNCGPIQNPGPDGKRTCGDTDGGLFVHSGSGINLDNSIARGVFYGDGNEGRLQNQKNAGFETLLQGAWTSGQVNTQPGTDVVAGEVPRQSLCSDGGFHYAIPDPGEGLTCDPLAVTIEGHDDDDSPTAPAEDTTVRITARVVDGNADPEWSNGSDTINYTWDGSEQSETFSLSVDRDSTINIDVEEPRGTASEKSPEEDPDIVFRGNALQFRTAIPDQIAGKPSNQSPGDQPLAIEALACEKDGSMTEVFSGDKEVEWAIECIDPSDGSGSICPNRPLDMDTEEVDPGFTTDFSAPTNETDGVTDYISRTEDFDESTVSFALRYPDAGRIRLHARVCTKQNTAPEDCKSKDLITGTSNTFSVRPFGFFVDFDPDGDGTFDDRATDPECVDQTSCSADASGDVFGVSGEAFPARISAVLWQASDDTDGDEGVPDSNRALADNGRAPSFGREDNPETVDLTGSRAAPTGGVDGSLAGGEGVGGFVDGSTIVNGLTWSEVGTVDLDVVLTDGSYFGAGDVTGRAPDLGRFIPARLRVAGNTPGFAPFCDPFTYLDQSFGYSTDPAVSVTAYNANGAVTRNYGDSFWKLPVPGAFPGRDYDDASTGTAILADDRTATTITWADGGNDSLDSGDTATVTGERLTYRRNGLEAPFEAAVELRIPAADLTDDDGVCPADNGTCNTGNGDTGDDLVFDGDAAEAGQQPIVGTELRFGRLRVDEAFGPETAPVLQRWATEYWTGDTWALNTVDTCTALPLVDAVRLDPDSDSTNGNEVDGTQEVGLSSGDGTTEIDTAAASVISDEIRLMAGEAEVRFAAPGTGNRGWIEVRSVLAVDFPHLLSDLDGDGNFGEEPFARVTFGVFAGQQDWIYLREVFPSP